MVGPLAVLDGKFLWISLQKKNESLYSELHWNKNKKSVRLLLMQVVLGFVHLRSHDSELQ